jgi:hypothetical protein
MNWRHLLAMELALLAFTLGAPSALASVTRVYSVASCKGTNGMHDAFQAELKTGLAGNNTASIVCPLLTENDLAIEQVEVDVFDRNATSGADVTCTLYANSLSSGGIQTSFTDTASTTGSSSNAQVLTLDGPTDGPYVYVECTVPATVAGNASGVIGLRVTSEVDCTADSQCGNYSCDGGSCMTACTADNDCRSGRGCHHGSCVVPNCDENADCGSYTCDQHLCKTSCTVNSHCGAGRVCSGSACVTPNCTHDYQCGTFRCLNSVCATSCTTNAQCSGATTCESGDCVLDCGLWAPSSEISCFTNDCRRDDMCAPHAHCENSDQCVEDTPDCTTQEDEPCD